MNASKFMDKQIMDLSRSKSDPNTNTTNIITDDFLMNPQSEEETDVSSSPSSLKKKPNKKDEILPSYDFQPISRFGLPSLSSSLDSMPNSTSLKSYGSPDAVDGKNAAEKDLKLNDSALLSEIDGTMKKYTDSLLLAIDSLSARLCQVESKTRNLEYSIDDLRASIGNNHGSTDGKMRHLENILLEVQTGLQDIKDKQDVMEGHMQLAKLQISKVEKQSETSNTTHLEPLQTQPAASAPQQPNIQQQFPIAVQQPAPSLPLNTLLPPPSQQNVHLPPPGLSHYPASQVPPGSHFSPLAPTQEAPTQHYQIPPAQHQQQQPSISSPPLQQYQQAPTPHYPQPPQPPQQQHPPPVVGPQPEESPYAPAQTYPSSGPIQPQQPFYGGPPSSNAHYGPQSSDLYSYGGPPTSHSHYGGPSPSTLKPHQPHSPRATGGSNSSYPQIPTAKILPQAIPTASAISGGGSNSGGSGNNRVPIDDVVDKVTNMGFPREHVRATVRKLTDNGQSVDLNVVLDKLMNDGDLQPQRGWFGR